MPLKKDPSFPVGPTFYLMGDYGERYVTYHSTYKDWDIFRELHVLDDRPRMSYFAIKDGEEPLHSSNLSGIKECVSMVVDP